MNDAAFMRCGQRVRNLNRDRERAREIEWTTVNQFANVFAFDELHGDKMHAIQVVEIEDGADVRVIERRGESCFALEPFEVGFFDR